MRLGLLLFVSLWTKTLAISCMDGNGDPVDWWAMIKFPGGNGYAMYSDGRFYDSQKTLNGNPSALNYTLSQLFGPPDSFGYLMFNDQTPDGGDHESNAHQKGVIAFDQNEGFWLIHSTPNFPTPVAQGAFVYPGSAFVYGQSFLCMTLTTDVIEEAGGQLYISYPYVYDSNLPDNLASSVPNISSVINAQKASGSATNVLVFKTKGGIRFVSFSKNAAWNDDVYEEMVCPYYGSSFQWETWLNGVGTMASDCTPTATYDSINVQSISFQDGSNRTWKTTRDHSKWGASLSPDCPVACIGDINRQSSQARRGGGTVCTQNVGLFSAFYELVNTTSACSNSANYTQTCSIIYTDDSSSIASTITGGTQPLSSCGEIFSFGLLAASLSYILCQHK
eukprot:TRINITY_DN2521_c0_g1_i1.p1 TRINITY_DN2521_c0_g1~~TRINITY_DN2521_c0_g1_i1.p1  ORF type:complete len:392 (-),score=62.14 TRINITY_DN2521_c0_g1_i1:220-1395(-)